MYKVTQYSFSMTRGVMADAIFPQKHIVEKERVFASFEEAKKFLNSCGSHASLVRISDGAEFVSGCWDTYA